MLCSYFQETFTSGHICWFFPQWIAEIIYLLKYFLIKQSGSLSGRRESNETGIARNCGDLESALLFDLSQTTLREGLNEEATTASVTAAVLQYPGNARGAAGTS